MSARWILTVSELNASDVVKKAPGITATSPTENLLAFDAPSLMQEWLVASIRIPFIASAKPTAGEATATILLTTAILRVGGDIVWTQTNELSTLPVTLGIRRGQSVIAADLQNPVIVPHGRSFTIEITVSSSVETDNIGATIAGAAGQGAIAYTVHNLTGHREI